MINKLTFGLFTEQDTKSFMRLMAYVKPYKFRIIVALLAIIGVAITESYLAAFIAPLVNQGFVIPDGVPPIKDGEGLVASIIHLKDRFMFTIWGTESKVWIVPIFFMALVIFRGICRFVSQYLMSWVAIMAISHLRRDMFDKMLSLPSEYYQANTSGHVLMNIVQMADTSINNASNVFITLTRDTLIVIGLVCVLFYLNWQLALAIMVMFPILSALSKYYRNRLKHVLSDSQLSIGTLNTTIGETHQGQRIIKLFGGQIQASKRFDGVNSTIVRLTKKITQATAARSPISEAIGSLALAAVIFIALWQSQAGVTTIGEFMAFIVAMMQMFGPIKNLANISIPMQAMFLAADSVCEFMDTKPEADHGKVMLDNISGNIYFKNIEVRYGQDKTALNKFNLNIKAGEKVALVGRSGSGKTTAINLLPRFITPSSGEILLDGIDINTIKLENLRAQFALVTQEIFLFDDTLFENVRYSRPSATEADVMAALEAANLTELVNKHPLGLHQPIGANGSQLSGGQRQRVSIARAILKDAPILLLDEATSALDNESERLVQQALERLMQGRTSIIVAHRLSTIEQADRIIVMDEGKIIEEGSHHELMAKGGYYAKLQNLTERA
ncbi:lipid A export permease/ATP-binding protein MsbA [Moraxella sp. RCAD0137]|uniref:lipid A export permease/ATP-binding protein MsbA n=1 Tax=Moraxella sp. RCAD0137 TaxID=1775913 RepID=UPI000C9FD959|nr:lipid A export permease/ATP-binding protein MsbA [Moraxella sp. RCAD0137]PNP98974.1 lipid A export permease/ATP-binding protein MsbA [Moraxella sp. RCAD0137]